jgi:hypothetical protein
MQWNNTVCLNRGENVYCVIPGLIRYTDTVESVESGTPRDQDNVSDCTSFTPLTFHILIFSSETARPIDLKFGRKHLWKVLYKIAHFIPIH